MSTMDGFVTKRKAQRVHRGMCRVLEAMNKHPRSTHPEVLRIFCEVYQESSNLNAMLDTYTFHEELHATVDTRFAS